jgi:hypothetical protein
VRLAACAAVSLLALLAASCNGGGDNSETASWAGPPPPADDGSVAVEDFAAHQESVDASWERSAEMAAAEFLRLDERTVVRTAIEGNSEGEGGGPRTVIVTLDGLLDDSIRAEQWQLEFEQTDDAYELSSAVRTLRCQPGRGHQDFTAEPCL